MVKLLQMKLPWETYHYLFVKTHRMHIVHSVNCGLWLLMVCQCRLMYHCGSAVWNVTCGWNYVRILKTFPLAILL
jgi:hypothetical protein